MRVCTVLNRFTMDKKSKDLLFKNDRSDYKEFFVNDPVVMYSENTAFYWLITIMVLMKLHTVLYSNFYRE